MALIDAYLSSKFIEEFTENNPLPDLSSEKTLPWISLYQLLDTKAKLHLSGQKTEYSRILENNPLARSLINQFIQGSDRINFDNWQSNLDIDGIESNCSNPIKYFFSHSLEHNIKDFCTSAGFPNLNTPDTNRLKLISQKESLQVTLTEFKIKLGSWQEIKSNLLPFNSLIICDNYLLSDYKAVENNLFKLLEEFIRNCTSANAENKIQITIICGKLYWKKKSKSEEDFDIVSNRISNFLINKFKDRNIDYSLVKLKEVSDYHDRNIITNSQFIKSGNSFNYFNKDSLVKLKSSTIIDFASLSAKNKEDLIVDLIEASLFDLYTAIKEKASNVFGRPLENRIFNLVKSETFRNQDLENKILKLKNMYSKLP